MGELKVIKLSNEKDKADYIHRLIKDIQALELMIAKDMIEKAPIRIGAEQEFCLVDDEFYPIDNAPEILAAIDDEHFTTEIGRYNLEINLDPFELKDDCFSKIDEQLSDFLLKAREIAKEKNAKIMLTGILPTLALKHLGDKYMTPIPRYEVLNNALKESRGQDFNIHIKGVDEINLMHDSVMLEGCNTSFQVHLQIDPDDFVMSYNWAQAISGPVLSTCTNSPLLFGKELWSETRIALFTQSVDTRANSFLLHEKQSRVSFGKSWGTGSVIDVFKDNISRFRSLVTSGFNSDSLQILENGETPKLKALNLHNGTVYRWNRPCYGVGDGKPHLRIENRYLPSGPTIKDEIANMMFWIGLMVGRPKEYDNIHEKMDFKDAKANFFNAARYGMAAQFFWNGKYISSHRLIIDELLPIAFKGLYRVGITPREVVRYLTIVENRVRSHNGSQWMIQNYRTLLRSNKPFESIQTLTSEMYKQQESGIPVAKWKPLKDSEIDPAWSESYVKHKMTTDIFTVSDNDSIELVFNIMKWKNIHHMPVINVNRELIGLLDWVDIEAYSGDVEQQRKSVKSIMKTDVKTISQYKTLNTARELMSTHGIDCLPVTKEKKLIGLITSKDL
jgi:CBS domain-containing protein